MPKKSDRPNHGTALSHLFPDVSLEEEQNETEKKVEQEERHDSSTELEESRTTDVQNYSSGKRAQLVTASEEGKSEESDPADAREQPTKLQPFPPERPDLSRKLGPYVSEDVDEALEDVYLMLRRHFGSKANKSLIVEAALRYSLSDCLEREEESGLAKWLEEVLNSR